ncbi:unnamed protein product [Caenorhabditis brenneri]
MPLSFFNFAYPEMKCLVDQMSEVDLVRVSLQNERAHNLLKEYGKENVSLFNLSMRGIYSLSEFDQVELFIKEAARQHRHSDETSGTLRVSLSETPSLTIKCKDLFSVQIYVEALGNSRQYKGKRRNMTIGDDLVPTVFVKDSRKLVAFWENRLHALTALLDLLINKCNVTIQDFDVDGSEDEDFSETLRTIVGFCSPTQLQSADIGREKCLTDEDTLFVLTHLTATKFFSIHSNTKKNFKFNGKISSDSIFINNAHWFKLRNLVENGNNKKIEVEGVTISKAGVKQFVKRWANGEFPNLEYLHLKSNNKIWPNLQDMPKSARRHPAGRAAFRFLREFSYIAGSHGGAYAAAFSRTDRDFILQAWNRRQPDASD